MMIKKDLHQYSLVVQRWLPEQALPLHDHAYALSLQLLHCFYRQLLVYRCKNNLQVKNGVMKCKKEVSIETTRPSSFFIPALGIHLLAWGIFWKAGRFTSIRFGLKELQNGNR